jgi:hypothetical protein
MSNSAIVFAWRPPLGQLWGFGSESADDTEETGRPGRSAFAGKIDRALGPLEMDSGPIP